MKYEVLQAGPKSWTWHIRVGAHITNAGHGLDTQAGAIRALCQHVCGQAKYIVHALHGIGLSPAQKAELCAAIRKDVRVIKKSTTKEKTNG